MPISRRAVPAVLVMGALCAPALANAAFPTFKTTKTIVVGKSIGGVALGSSPAKGKKAWGAKGAQCFDTDPGSGYCNWRKSKNDIYSGEGTFGFTKGKITKIELKSPVKGSGRAFVKPFTIPETSKKIGIGSKFSAVAKAYPKGKYSDSRKNIFKVQSGSRLTLFESFGTNKVAGISVEILPSD